MKLKVYTYLEQCKRYLRCSPLRVKSDLIFFNYFYHNRIDEIFFWWNLFFYSKQVKNVLIDYPQLKECLARGFLWWAAWYCKLNVIDNKLFEWIVSSWTVQMRKRCHTRPGFPPSTGNSRSWNFKCSLDSIF